MILLNDIYSESPTKAKSRLKIVDTAFSLFTEDGIDSVSMTNVADSSEITLRNLYRYYPSKEALISDVAYHYISTFNNIHKVYVNESLSGYEQLRYILENQIKNDILAESNHKVITFIAYFNIYMTTSNDEHEAIKHYIKVYAPLLKDNILNSMRQALIKGIQDNTLDLEITEVDFHVGYIFHSLMSIISRVAVKRYDQVVNEFGFVHKQISVLLKHLKK